MSDSRKIKFLSVVYVLILVSATLSITLITKSFALGCVMLASLGLTSILGVEEGRCRQRLIHSTPTNELEQQQ